MSSFTLAYLARLEAWGFAAAVAQGVLLWASWRLWDKAVARIRAELRHGIACAHFAALAGAPILTIAVLQLGLARMPDRASDLPVLDLGARMASDPPSFALDLGLVWLAGTAVMGGALLVQMLRLGRPTCGPASVALHETLHRLGEGWLRRAPDLRLAAVAAPQVTGLRRPVVAAPPDIQQRLSHRELEAVLLHELAHVGRGDFGWNLAQRGLLALLWFHPAAWALYRDVAREREACCDALAVRRGAKAVDLARALVRLAEAGPSLAMALSQPSDLSDRVRRLAGVAVAPAPWSRPAGAMVSGLCLLAVAGGGLGAADPATKALYDASAFAPTVSILAHDAAGAFALRMRQGRVVAAALGGRALPPSRIRQDGRRVVLLGDGRQQEVDLTITAQGRVRWEGRR